MASSTVMSSVLNRSTFHGATFERALLNMRSKADTLVAGIINDSLSSNEQVVYQNVLSTYREFVGTAKGRELVLEELAEHQERFNKILAPWMELKTRSGANEKTKNAYWINFAQSCQKFARFFEPGWSESAVYHHFWEYRREIETIMKKPAEIRFLGTGTDRDTTNDSVLLAISNRFVNFVFERMSEVQVAASVAAHINAANLAAHSSSTAEIIEFLAHPEIILSDLQLKYLSIIANLEALHKLVQEKGTILGFARDANPDVPFWVDRYKKHEPQSRRLERFKNIFRRQV